MPEADSETSLVRRGSGMVQLPDLRGCQERGGWGRAGNSERATQRASLGSGSVARPPENLFRLRFLGLLAGVPAARV